MQRIIKFRAWDGKYMKMRHKVVVGNLHDEENYTAHAVYLKPGDTDYNIDFPGRWMNFDEHSNFVLMQFTGLTDKNGKDIYEGDILSHHKKASLYKDCPIEIIGAVVYTNGKFETETIKVINENFLDNSSIHFGIEPIDWIHLPNFKQSEVIGNIYENPELCKG